MESAERGFLKIKERAKPEASVMGLMKAQSNRLKRLNARITNKLFLMYATLESRLFSKRKMRILLSDKQDWRRDIEKGFRNTWHTAVFAEFSAAVIRDYDLVVPLTIRDLKYLDRIRECVGDNPIPIPSLASVLLCDDKYVFNQTLMVKGFGEFIPKMGKSIERPYILKKRVDEWGKNSHLIASLQQEQDVSDIRTDAEYFLQEFIVGPCEYATHILFKNQRVVRSINIKYEFETETPIKGRDKPIYKKVCGCPYMDVFSSILASIGFEGLCCLNYKVFEGRPLILEVNPRFGGSLGPFFFAFISHLGDVRNRH